VSAAVPARAGGLALRRTRRALIGWWALGLVAF
jgi:hypothetical protein